VGLPITKKEMFIAESTSEKMFIGEYLAQLQEKAGLCCAVSST